MTDRDTMQNLHSAVHSYLSVLDSIAACLGNACPGVGTPHQQRIARMRTRLSFNANKESIEQTTTDLQAQLAEYATQAAVYADSRFTELQNANLALEGIIRTMADLQDFHASRIREMASRLETGRYPSNEREARVLLTDHCEELRASAESMVHGALSELAHLREVAESSARRLGDAEITDPVTGMLNRAEMERRLEYRRKLGVPPIQLRFRIQCVADQEQRDAVMKQIAARLASQCRHNDVLSRWSTNEFLVMFNGTAERAAPRSRQIAQGLSGRYTLPQEGLPDGESGPEVDVVADVELLIGEDRVEDLSAVGTNSRPFLVG